MHADKLSFYKSLTDNMRKPVWFLVVLLLYLCSKHSLQCVMCLSTRPCHYGCLCLPVTIWTWLGQVATTSSKTLFTNSLPLSLHKTCVLHNGQQTTRLLWCASYPLKVSFLYVNIPGLLREIHWQYIGLKGGCVACGFLKWQASQSSIYFALQFVGYKRIAHRPVNEKQFKW